MMRRRVRTRWWPREWHWYSRFGIERPFPWLAIGACAIPILIIIFALTLAVVLC